MKIANIIHTRTPQERYWNSSFDFVEITEAESQYFREWMNLASSNRGYGQAYKREVEWEVDEGVHIKFHGCYPFLFDFLDFDNNVGSATINFDRIEHLD